mmetsp:Transcript_56200/g.162896  ORF Transcript_56200/g.162896 Transcript_56200/m.162896 type:complete len:211 (+) Transcript_56200:351-983(+)
MACTWSSDMCAIRCNSPSNPCGFSTTTVGISGMTDLAGLCSGSGHSSPTVEKLCLAARGSVSVCTTVQVSGSTASRTDCFAKPRQLIEAKSNLHSGLIVGKRSAFGWSNSINPRFMSFWNSSSGRSLGSFPNGISNCIAIKFKQTAPNTGKNVTPAAVQYDLSTEVTSTGVHNERHMSKTNVNWAYGNGNLVFLILVAFNQFTSPRDKVW